MITSALLRNDEEPVLLKFTDLEDLSESKNYYRVSPEKLIILEIIFVRERGDYKMAQCEVCGNTYD